jgi:hypothetical protein
LNVSKTGAPQDGAPRDVGGLEVIKPGTQGTLTPGTVNELIEPNGPKYETPPEPPTISRQAK